MRKLIVHEFMTLDGIMQAPGDPFGDMMNAPKKYVVSRRYRSPSGVDNALSDGRCRAALREGM